MNWDWNLHLGLGILSFGCLEYCAYILGWILTVFIETFSFLPSSGFVLFRIDELLEWPATVVTRH